MHDVWSLVPALLAGLVLGAIFFGGLWWTVRQGLASPRPAVWFFASLLLRMGLALTGLYLVSGGQLERLLACLCGFALGRLIVTRITRLEANRVPLAGEVGRAS
ncbi:MAG: ATP synthase subunit I [Nitrospira sp.]|nr:ATP synthase subunit I [Nitrospira sp.]